MILLVNTCKEPLHAEEFVRPIEDILRKEKIKFTVSHYKKLTKNILDSSDKAIICGTSLKDFDYFNNFKHFEWIKTFDKPLLGICSGMQIIVSMMGSEILGSGKNIKDRIEIGMTQISFDKEFLGMGKGNHEVYELHQAGVRKVREYFDVFALSNKGIQAIKHKIKPFYGLMFHPEVRNKEMIVNFAKL